MFQPGNICDLSLLGIINQNFRNVWAFKGLFCISNDMSYSDSELVLVSEPSNFWLNFVWNSWTFFYEVYVNIECQRTLAFEDSVNCNYWKPNLQTRKYWNWPM